MRYKEIMYTNVERYAALESLRGSGMFGVSMAVNLDYVGREVCEKGHRFGPFTRFCFLVHVVLRGKGIYRVQGREYEIGENQAFVIFPGVESVYQADREDPWTYCWVGMHGYSVEELFSNLRITPGNPVIDLEDTKELEESVEELLKRNQLGRGSEMIRLGQTMRFLGLLETLQKKDQASDEDRQDPARVYVEYAMELIRNSFRENIRIGGIADQIGINRSYLARSFKKDTGMTPQEYLINYRLERAAQYLVNRDDSVSSVALYVGYSDQMAFSKAFKKKYGISPHKYRKERKNPVVRIDDKNLDLTRLAK